MRHNAPVSLSLADLINKGTARPAGGGFAAWLCSLAQRSGKPRFLPQRLTTCGLCAKLCQTLAIIAAAAGVAGHPTYLYLTLIRARTCL